MVPGRVAAGSPGNGSLTRAFPRGRANPSPGTGGCLSPSSVVVGWCAAPAVEGVGCPRMSRAAAVGSRTSAGPMCVGALRVGRPRVSAGDSCLELGAEGSLHRPEPGRETRTGGDEKVGHGPSVGSAEVTSLGSVVLGRIPGAMGVCVGSGGGRSRERQGRGPGRVSTVARCKSPGCYSSVI